jgi:hypothetical protein
MLRLLTLDTLGITLLPVVGMWAEQTRRLIRLL